MSVLILSPDNNSGLGADIQPALNKNSGRSRCFGAESPVFTEGPDKSVRLLTRQTGFASQTRHQPDIRQLNFVARFAA